MIGLCLAEVANDVEGMGILDRGLGLGYLYSRVGVILQVIWRANASNVVSQKPAPLIIRVPQGDLAAVHVSGRKIANTANSQAETDLTHARSRERRCRCGNW
jgi:hypothetical protein